MYSIGRQKKGSRVLTSLISRTVLADHVIAALLTSQTTDKFSPTESRRLSRRDWQAILESIENLTTEPVLCPRPAEEHTTLALL